MRVLLTAERRARAQQTDKRWLAVAPGRVEPPSGIVKVASPAIGIVSKVLVKVNDTVFAGEPLILLNDDEIQARYAAAEAQAGMRRRLRDEQAVTGKALERRRAEDAVAEQETAVFDAQAAVDKAAAQWRASGAPVAASHQRPRGAGARPGRVGETQGSAPRHRRAAADSERGADHLRARRSRARPRQSGEAEDPRADRRHRAADQHQSGRACRAFRAAAVAVDRQSFDAERARRIG